MLTHSDIGKLYKVFRSIDVDNSGTIEVNELMDGSKMEKNAFNDRVFKIFDEDGSGQIGERSLYAACSCALCV